MLITESITYAHRLNPVLTKARQGRSTAFQSGPFEAALATAAGEDGALQKEIRRDFLKSADRQLDLMLRSRCDANWQLAARRPHGLAGDFHATQLMEMAQLALAGAPGDPAALREIETHLSEMRGQSIG